MDHAGRNAKRRRFRRGLCLAAAAAAFVPLGPAAALDPAPATSASAPAPFVMCSDLTNVRIYHYYRRVYVEAFRRLGVPVEFAQYTLTRRAALAEEGAIDGEMARVRAFGDAHPRLVRVEEPIYDFSFSLYSARQDLRLTRLDELAGTRWSVEYRRGILMCEKELAQRVARERLSDVATTEQGIRKLVGGRTDLYCDLDEVVDEVIVGPEFRGQPVRRVLRFATLPTYPYLGEKHRALARRLAEVLKQMRAEGLLDRYLRDMQEGGGSGG